MFVAPACHSAAFISPPAARESAPTPTPAPTAVADPPEVLLARSMRPVVESWDGLSPQKREHAVREYGAALATLAGLPVERVKDGVRVRRARLTKILQGLGA